MSEYHGSFASCLGCKDGRTIDPIQDWAQKTYGVSYVDFDTEPGMDSYLNSCSEEDKDKLKKKVLISVEKHHARYVLVAGHADCAGNPVSDEEHKKNIADAVNIVRTWNMPEGISVTGLWVNPQWQVEEIL